MVSQLRNNSVLNVAEGAFLAFTLDFPTAAEVDVFAPLVFLELKGQGRLGIKGGIGQLLQVGGAAVQYRPFYLNAVDVFGFAPVVAGFVFVGDDAAYAFPVSNVLIFSYNSLRGISPYKVRCHSV